MEILIILAIALAVSLAVVFMMKSKMKSVRPKTSACDYVNNFVVTNSKDMFLYSRVTKIPKPQQNNTRRR